MKKFLPIFIFLLFLTSCNSDITTNEDEFKIASSIIPISSIVNYIGGDLISSTSIVPAGVSPHGFDLKVNDLKYINDSQLIIYLGLDHIDNFLTKAIDGKDVLNLTQEDIDFIDLNITETHEEDDEGEKHVHSIDPHVWTSPKNAKIIGKKVADKLIEIFPKEEIFLLENLLSFENELNTSIEQFKENIQGKEQKGFIIFHDAYNYLFEELGMDINKKIVFQKSVLSEMSLDEMKKMIDLIKKENVKIIFKEPQFQNVSINEFAEENDLIILDLDPIGIDSGYKGYIDNLNKNLKNLENIYE